MEFLTWLEQSRLAVTVSESSWIYPLVLTLHTVGLGFLVGTSAAIDLRILGVASELPLAPMEKFFPVMYAGFWVNALTGVLLFISSATDLGTNRTYLTKMLFVLFGAVTVWLMRTRVFRDRAVVQAQVLPARAKRLAWASLIVWALAITAGRFTAYIR